MCVCVAREASTDTYDNRYSCKFVKILYLLIFLINLVNLELKAMSCVLTGLMALFMINIFHSKRHDFNNNIIC